MAKPYPHTYINELSFITNRIFQDYGKETADSHTSIIELIEEFSQTSAIQIHAEVLKTSLKHLDSGWASMLQFELKAEPSELSDVTDVKSTFSSLWLEFAKKSETPDLFLTIETKSLGVIPLSFWKGSQKEEIRSWAETWLDKHPDLNWSYSIVTVSALLWVIRNTVASVVTESEDAIHICGVYQGSGRDTFEQIDVIIDNEPALRTEALLKKL